MSSTWLIIDPICPTPYDLKSLTRPGLGGTEATVLRVAQGLIGLGDEVTVMQHCRNVSQNKTGFIAPDLNTQADTIICLRDAAAALAARQRYRSRPVYLWLHDCVTLREVKHMQALYEKGVQIVCVSQWHYHQLMDAVRTYAPELTSLPKVHIIHNPIADDLNPDTTLVDPNKLIFFSSPHKGLDWALKAFHSLRLSHPNLALYVANPGYFHKEFAASPGVHFLGDLSHQECLQHVRESFCVFYPNHVFPETFGLVFAEANAVGTPVLTHAIGAAREVLSTSDQFVDTRDIPKLVEKFTLWTQGNRPNVKAQEQFRLARIVQRWKSLE